MSPLLETLEYEESDNAMENQHRFRVVAWWAAGQTGIAQSNSALPAIHFSSPPAFGGLNARWTPEDLLLCSLASCYTTTFGAIAKSSKFPYTDLQVEVEGAISKTDPGYNFGAIVIRAKLIIPTEQKADPALALKLLQKAKELCLISRALSVEQRFELRVQLGESRASLAQSSPLPNPVSNKENRP
jgi:peroxiredoxin-like protein